MLDRGKVNKYLAIGFMLALVACLPLFVNRYYLHLAIMSGLGVILALGLNLLYGYSGQINFGVAAFYAIGAYAVALLQAKAGLYFFASLAIALIIAVLVALIISLPLLRLRHLGLALGTLAFAVIIYSLACAMRDFTGGSDGLVVPKLVLLGYKAGTTFYFYMVLVLAIACYLACHHLVSSKIGRALMAIREDESAALASGINVDRYKRLAFTINALFTALAGGIYAQHAGFIAPALFDVHFNLLGILMVVVGGPSNLGSVIGGIFIMLLPEFVIAFKGYHIMAYGLILVLVLMFMPRGITGLIKAGTFKRSQTRLGRSLL